MTSPISQEIEKRDASPRALVEQFSNSFAAVLPTHIRPDTWVRIAQGALKKGKRLDNGRTELEEAALNNPGVFLAALLDAARQGLEPGTEQYYLTPRKVKNRLEILGITGYQGLIEKMYRAGAVSAVIAEVVRTKDTFIYRPGIDTIPLHEIDWESDDRGDLRLVYAYARMKDGATSRVIVMSRSQIELIKKSAQGASSQYSPWNTHPEAMWLKSAARQLAKWVPTSSEYLGLTVAAPVERPALPVSADIPEINFDSGEGLEPDDDVIDGETVEDYPEGQEPFE